MKLNKGIIIQIMNDYLEVEHGYLNGFDTYRTLEEFYPVYCDLEIDIYTGYDGTIRNRFKQIFDKSNYSDQIKIIKGIFEFYPVNRFDLGNQVSKRLFKDNIITKIDDQLKTNVITDDDIKAHFSKIQTEIIKEIDKAQFIIQVAVAWFTDPIIFSKLAKKHYNGVTVELILHEHKINRNSGLDYEKYLNVFWASSGRTMHHKYCIIDLKTCITGSYNWTKMAAYNNIENVTIKKGTGSVLEYAKDFVKMKSTIKKNKIRPIE